MLWFIVTSLNHMLHAWCFCVIFCAFVGTVYCSFPSGCPDEPTPSSMCPLLACGCLIKAPVLNKVFL